MVETEVRCIKSQIATIHTVNVEDGDIFVNGCFVAGYESASFARKVAKKLK